MKMKITELSNYQELNFSDAATITGGQQVYSTQLSPTAASYLAGKQFFSYDKITYSVFYENGKLSDQLYVISDSNPNDNVKGAYYLTGIIY